MSSTRSLIFIAAGVLALVVLSIGAVFLAGRESVEFAEGTPERALQRYLAAFDEGDLAAAHGYFSSDVRDEMDLETFERTVEMYEGGYPADRSRRALFDGRSGDGDTVRLEITVEEFTGEGLNASTYRYQREIRMIRQGADWRIDEPLVWLDPAPIQEHP